MGEKRVYLPKYYFITILMLSIVTIAFLSYFAMSDFIGILTLLYVSAIFSVTIIFSYLSYKGKIPYMVIDRNKGYASEYQLYLVLIILLLSLGYFIALSYLEGEKVYLPLMFVTAVFIISAVFVYFSYKRKIPLLKME